MYKAGPRQNSGGREVLYNGMFAKSPDSVCHQLKILADSAQLNMSQCIEIGYSMKEVIDNMPNKLLTFGPVGLHGSSS